MTLRFVVMDNSVRQSFVEHEGLLMFAEEQISTQSYAYKGVQVHEVYILTVIKYAVCC